ASALSPNLQAGLNRLRAVFLDPAEQALYPDWDQATAGLVAGFRESVGTDAGDPGRAGHRRGSGPLGPGGSLTAVGAGGDLVRGPGVDHPVGRDAVPLGALAAVLQPVELAGRVRVGVDGEQAASLGREAQDPAWRVPAFRAAVDL